MGSFKKYEGNPVFGNEATGTVFDAYMLKINGKYRMDFSWRPKKALAVTFSDDGIHWEEPIITLECNPESGWEDDINRNCVLYVDGIYKMWYTGQSHNHTYSYIGYAESTDGIHFERKVSEPVLLSEYPWEKESVMCPCVLYEDDKYKMWYSAGETYEPNVIAYAESDDGINWRKSRINPIFIRNKFNSFEKERVGACYVVYTEDMGYLMFYIGYENIDTARVCVAKSKNGISGWERSPINPLVEPTPNAWDAAATYRPAVVWNEEAGKWMLWYNGRTGGREYIGYAEYEKRDLF